MWFELATVTSQTLQCDIINYVYTPYAGLNCTILDKITQL